MHKYEIEDAPAAIGPYSHAVRSGNLVFLSGQTPLDPGTMQISGASIEAQTARALANLASVLSGLGMGLQNVVKTTVFLQDMSDFEGMNAVYRAQFGDHRPARTTVAVRQNPLGALVEIECIAEAPA